MPRKPELERHLDELCQDKVNMFSALQGLLTTTTPDPAKHPLLSASREYVAQQYGGSVGDARRVQHASIVSLLRGIHNDDGGPAIKDLQPSTLKRKALIRDGLMKAVVAADNARSPHVDGRRHKDKEPEPFEVHNEALMVSLGTIMLGRVLPYVDQQAKKKPSQLLEYALRLGPEIKSCIHDGSLMLLLGRHFHGALQQRLGWKYK